MTNNYKDDTILLTMETSKQHLERLPDPASELEAIVDRPLTAESIDSYAEQALNDLVKLVRQVSAAYCGQPAYFYKNSRELENAAFAYFGLRGIEETLDHIADKAEEINGLNQIIAEANVTNQVILPPDPNEISIIRDNGTFQEKITVPRLKTLLFILGNEFQADLQDKSQIRITKGAAPKNSLRHSSYYLVEAPVLDRSVLMCDEEGNATYVFVASLLEQEGKSLDDLLCAGKTELNAWIKRRPGLGRKIMYTKNFIPNLIEALEDDGLERPEPDRQATQKGRYLRPTPPEGSLRKGALARLLGVDRKAIYRAIEQLGESLGEIEEFISPNQQELIRQQLEATGVFAEKMPEGYLSVGGFRKNNHLDNRTLGLAITSLGDELGEIKRYKSGTVFALCLSPSQQDMLLGWLEAAGRLAERAPEGVVSRRGLSRITGVSYRTIQRCVHELGSKLGEIKLYKFVNKIALGYTPEQQTLIVQYMESKGILGAAAAPEGYLSARGLSKQLHVSPQTVRRAIAALGESLGEVSVYKFGSSQIVPGYSPRQQAIIKAYLVDRGLVDPN